MSVLLMKIYDRGEGEPVNAASVIRSVATHPLIIAALLGILCSLSGVVLPTIIIEPIRDLAGAAAPIAMLGLGARLNFRSAAEHRASAGRRLCHQADSAPGGRRRRGLAARLPAV